MLTLSHRAERSGTQSKRVFQVELRFDYERSDHGSPLSEE